MARRRGVQDDRSLVLGSVLVGVDLLGDAADEFLDVVQVGVAIGVHVRAEIWGQLGNQVANHSSSQALGRPASAKWRLLLARQTSDRSQQPCVQS